jgi:cytochrome c oxidase subunit 4
MSKLEAATHVHDDLVPAREVTHVQPLSDGNVHAHVSSLKFYIAIFVALCLLTILTVVVSNVHLGRANLIVAVIIASMKASLVLLFFMHLRYDNKFNAMILIVAIMFIGVFFAYTLNDTEHRGEIDGDQGVRVLPKTGETAPGGLPEE